MGRKSRAIYFTAPRQVEVREESAKSENGTVGVTSLVSAVSHGTEMLFYRGPFPTGAHLESLPGLNSVGYPVKYGYMSVGHTDDGQRVFVFAPHETFISAHPSSIIGIPGNVENDDAVLYPSVETALQIVHDAAPRLAESVTVFGLGVIGSTVCDLLRRMDVRVVAVDPDARRRKRAADEGLVVADARGGAARDEIRTLAGGGSDISINSSGSAEALQLAIETTRMEGTIIEASWYGAKETRVSLGGEFHRRRLTIRSSQVSNLNPLMTPRWDRLRRSETVMGLLPVLRPSRLITHRFPLSRAAEAYELIHNDPGSATQVVFDMKE